MVLDVNEQTFTQEVLACRVPVLVDFWAPWCGVCRLMNPFLNKFQSEWEAPIKVVSINADENLKLANTYRLSTLPTVLLFSDGKVILRIDKFQNRDDLRVAAEELKLALKTAHLTYGYSA